LYKLTRPKKKVGPSSTAVKLKENYLIFQTFNLMWIILKDNLKVKEED